MDRWPILRARMFPASDCYDAQDGERSFSPSNPASRSPTQNNRGRLADSLYTTMSTITLPTAPIPVQTAYDVPSGIDRIATASRTKLASIVTIVQTLGQSFVNPSDCFIPAAQTTSSN